MLVFHLEESDAISVAPESDYSSVAREDATSLRRWKRFKSEHAYTNITRAVPEWNNELDRSNPPLNTVQLDPERSYGLKPNNALGEQYKTQANTTSSVPSGGTCAGRLAAVVRYTTCESSGEPPH